MYPTPYPIRSIIPRQIRCMHFSVQIERDKEHAVRKGQGATVSQVRPDSEKFNRKGSVARGQDKLKKKNL